MRKKTLMIGLILLVVAGIGLYFLIPKKDLHKAKDAEREKSEKTQPPKKKDQEEEIIVSKPDYYSEKQWEKVKILVKHFSALNKPVDFYGKIVDQFDNPVEGANVAIRLRSFNENILKVPNSRGDIETRHTLRTDEKGLFNLKAAKANSILIEEVSKDGFNKYSLTSTSGINFTTSDGKSLEFDHAKPAIYKIINTAQTEPLYKGEFRREKISTGDVYYIDFKKRKVEKEKSQSSSLKIEIHKGKIRENNRTQYEQREWSYSLEALEGGIIEVEPNTYIASESGYKESVSFTTENTDNFSDMVDKTYILCNNNFQYSLIKFHLNIYQDEDRASLSCEYYLNPKSGSRNLSYDSSKALRKWPDNQAQ